MRIPSLAFRKQGLGLLAISRVIDIFGENCGLVAMKPFPLQFGNYLDSGRHASNDLQDLTTEFRIAKQKLRRYWERAGFNRVGGTEYWALCPASGRPSLKNINSAIDKACAADE